MNPLQALKVAAHSAQIPFELLRAICTVESGLNAAAMNPVDGNSPSHGMCQIKYNTAKGVGFKGKVHELYKAKTNALYAAKYLKHQLTRYDGDWIKAVSAYNRGTAAKTNMHYVRKVFSNLIKEDLIDVRSRCKNPKHPCCTGINANALQGVPRARNPRGYGRDLN